MHACTLVRADARVPLCPRARVRVRVRVRLCARACARLRCARSRTPDAPLAIALHLLDLYVWPWVFLGEFLVKAIALGLLLGEGAYLRSWWHRLDFGVVVTCLLIVAEKTTPQVEFLDDVRVVRALGFQPAPLASIRA